MSNPTIAGVNTALQSKQLNAQLEQMAVQNAKTVADTGNTVSQTKLNDALVKKATAETLNTTLQSAKQANENKLATAKAPIYDLINSMSNSAKGFIDNLNATPPPRPKLPPFKLRSDAERLRPYMKTK